MNNDEAFTRQAKVITCATIGSDKLVRRIKMAIPGFQTLMLPLLQFAADGKEHATSEARERMAEQFHLSDEERKKLLPSGKQAVFQNRVAWALAYLRMAGLLASTRRGSFQITKRGQDTLTEGLPKIDIRFLMQFEEFRELRTGRKNKGNIDHNDSDTPEEKLAQGYREIRDSLAQELLTRVKGSSPSFFEKMVVDLLLKMGYGGSLEDAGKSIGQTGDGGIDGLIKEDRLGLDVVYIQAKRWENVVGRPEIQKFVGALQGERARKGVFITTSKFSSDASEFSKRVNVNLVLIDGPQLAQYMIDFDIGVSRLASYEIKRVDSDYFGEE
jgi:restriction system protein